MVRSKLIICFKHPLEHDTHEIHSHTLLRKHLKWMFYNDVLASTGFFRARDAASRVVKVSGCQDDEQEHDTQH